MPKEYLPELTNYLDKMVSLKLNANRQVSGTLIGFDTFMNIVLDNAFEELHDGDRNNIGKVVIRGNSVIQIEALESIA